jgi:uncharacterized protein YlxW (UPF0749 family)
MMAKFGSGIAAGGAVIATADPSTAVGFVNQHGVVGILIVIALVLWAKSERQEKKADELREQRRLEERERYERQDATMNRLADAINAMHESVRDLSREPRR